MKKWNAAEIEELNIEQTAHNWLGKYSDGGYIGDGVISGHSTNTKPNPTPTTPTPAPSDGFTTESVENQLS